LSTLIVLPVQGGQLPTTAAELLGAAQSLSDPIDALVVGPGALGLAGGLAVRRAFVADDPSLAPYTAETWLPVVADAVHRSEATLVLFPHTLLSRELAPRLAFRLGAGLVTDCVALKQEDGALVMTKPVYGGNALADYALESTPALATLRPGAFAAAEGSGSPEVVAVEVSPTPARTTVVETVRAAASSGPALKDARVVVSGGRGLGGPENWHYVEELAAALGGAVGASRAVTDAGWVPPSLQVGLTGTTVNPDLYVAVGISGAVQHMAGCSGSRNLVAINRDADANVFRHARWGIVGDFKEVLPALTARIKELRGSG
jgi:electron transfer flavoprotein alpha subunit